MALNSLFCADVPLRNYSLSLTPKFVQTEIGVELILIIILIRRTIFIVLSIRRQSNARVHSGSLGHLEAANWTFESACWLL